LIGASTRPRSATNDSIGLGNQEAVNLLVTNTRAAQAYFIIRALRPQAEKIVVTIYGKTSLTAWLSHAATSRLVDKRYHVPSPAGNWKKGKLGKANSQTEEAYVKNLLKICETERIDTVFPSWDAQIYLLAKNKERFEQLGVLIPIPDYETLIISLDKYRIVQVAQKAGLACPRTYLPERLEDLGDIADDLGFPITVKPRYTSWGTEIVRDRESLFETTQEIAETYGMPLLQEYIPEGERQDIHLLLDKSGASKLVFPRTTRRTLRLDPHAHFSTVHEFTNPNPHTPEAVRLVQMLGWWGSATVETAVDPRDGKAKFTEFVPRFRRQLWNTMALGVNEPWMCLKIARGETVEPIKDCPLGVMFLSPVEDMLVLVFQLLDLLAYKFRTRMMRKAPLDLWNRPQTLKQLWRSFVNTYFGPNRKLLDPYFKYFLQDPLVSILWWFQLSSWMLGLARRLGR
jgi:biotin carboxylase